MTESELQSLIVNMAESRGWMVHPASQGSQNAPRRAVRNRTANGFPDLVLGRDYDVMFLELKTDEGKLSQAQTLWSRALPHCHIVRPGDVQSGWLSALLS